MTAIILFIMCNNVTKPQLLAIVHGQLTHTNKNRKQVLGGKWSDDGPSIFCIVFQELSNYFFELNSSLYLVSHLSILCAWLLSYHVSWFLPQGRDYIDESGRVTLLSSRLTGWCHVLNFFDC